MAQEGHPAVKVPSTRGTCTNIPMSVNCSYYLPWQSRVYLEPLKVVEFVQLTTECCWGQPSDPCQRGCLTSHACVMWGPRTLNADDDDDDELNFFSEKFHV